MAELDAGADDYGVNPFDWLELLARLRTLARHSSFNETRSMLSLERVQIELASSSDLIETVHGVVYRLKQL